MELVEHRDIRRRGIHCNLAIEQLSSGVVLLKISGSDVSEFGEAPMLVLNDWLAGSAPVELFIDARDVREASIEVSGDWARWLATQKAKLQTVTMLTGSRFIQVTAEFVRRFADLHGIMSVCSEPEVFDRLPAAALRSL